MFVDALHEAFAESREPESGKHILEAMSRTVPLAQFMDGQIAALRHWAKGRAREAGEGERKSGRGRGRRINPELTASRRGRRGGHRPAMRKNFGTATPRQARPPDTQSAAGATHRTVMEHTLAHVDAPVR